MVVISSRSSRPPEMAQTCSTTSARVKRPEWAHNPMSGSVRTPVISSQPGASTPGFAKHTPRSNTVPTAKSTASASLRHRSASRLGVNE